MNTYPSSTVVPATASLMRSVEPYAIARDQETVVIHVPSTIARNDDIPADVAEVLRAAQRLQIDILVLRPAHPRALKVNGVEISTDTLGNACVGDSLFQMVRLLAWVSNGDQAVVSVNTAIRTLEEDEDDAGAERETLLAILRNAQKAGIAELAFSNNFG